MADGQRYRVLFQGKAREGMDMYDLRQSMQRLFRLDERTSGRVFSGDPVVIKPRADEPTAAKFKQIIEEFGGICWYEPVNGSAEPYRDRRQGPRRHSADRRSNRREYSIRPDRRASTGRRYEDG